MLNALDVLYRGVQRRCHRLMHRLRLMSFDEIRCPPVSAQQLLQFLSADAGKHGWIGDLVTVQMQDR